MVIGFGSFTEPILSRFCLLWQALRPIEISHVCLLCWPTGTLGKRYGGLSEGKTLVMTSWTGWIAAFRSGMMCPMDPNWAALAAAIKKRRKTLRYSQDALAKAADLSRSTIQKLEWATAENVEHETMTKLESGLEWAAGSVNAVLNGGDPTLAPETPSDAARLESRYRHATVVEGGRVLKIVEDMLFKVYMAGGTDQTFEDFDRTRRRLVEVLKEEGIEIAERHTETSPGTSEGP